MNSELFWKTYSRHLEGQLERAKTREAKRIADVILNGNHYLQQEETEAIKNLAELKMLYAEVVKLNRTEAP